MENFQKLVFGATVQPERYMFCRCFLGRDVANRYMFMFQANQTLTKSVFIMAEHGKIEHDPIKATTYIGLDCWDSLQIDMEEAGYDVITLQEFATELVALSTFFSEPLPKLI